MLPAWRLIVLGSAKCPAGVFFNCAELMGCEDEEGQLFALLCKALAVDCQLLASGPC